MPRGKKAFTLVELLVVIAIISILAALLLPALEEVIETGRRVACANNMKQIYLSAAGYADDHDDWLPTGGGYTGQSGLLFGSTRYWVRDYLEIPVYTKPAKSGGVPITGGNLYFSEPSPSDSVYLKNNRWYLNGTPAFSSLYGRGVLSCPSSDAANNPYYDYEPFDYYLSGFGSRGWYDGDVPFYTRLSRVAEMVKGEKKSFLMDNCYTRSGLYPNMIYWPVRLYVNSNCHRPNAPAGMNVCAGDGSIAWVNYGETYGMHNSFSQGPLGYYTQVIYGYSPSSGSAKTARMIRFYSPTGGYHQTYYNDQAAHIENFNKWKREWGNN